MEVTAPKTVPAEGYVLCFTAFVQPRFPGKQVCLQLQAVNWSRQAAETNARMASGTSAVGWPSPAEGWASWMGVIRNPQQQQGSSEPIVRACHYPLFPLLNAVVPIACLRTWFDLKNYTRNTMDRACWSGSVSFYTLKHIRLCCCSSNILMHLLL